MCVIAAKYFKDHGWVIAKNRDRNYPVEIKMVQSQRGGVERLFLRDLTTGYSEGLNEHGISIISASVMVKKDEKEGGGRASDSQNWTSPDGQRIRRGLYQRTVQGAVKSLIESKIPGNTFVTDGKKLVLIEAGLTNYGEENEKYHYIKKEISTKEIVVRTNHGILLPWTGYKMSDPDQKDSRISSNTRLKIATREVKKALDPQQLLNAIGVTPEKDKQMNPIRIDKGKGVMRTTGQILIVPNDKVMTYRPISSEVHLDNYNKINGVSSKTFFEIISNRELITFGAFKEGSESWEAGYKRRVVKTTKPEHKEKGYQWRIKGKDRDEISIKLYKDKPSFAEFKKQMERVAGHEFGG